MDIKNIVFEFGGVLVDWNPRYLYRKAAEEIGFYAIHFDNAIQLEAKLSTILAI